MQPSFLKSHGCIGAQREFELKDRLRRPPEAAALRAVLDFKFSLRLPLSVRFKEESAPAQRLRCTEGQGHCRRAQTRGGAPSPHPLPARGERERHARTAVAWPLAGVHHRPNSIAKARFTCAV